MNTLRLLRALPICLVAFTTACGDDASGGVATTVPATSAAVATVPSVDTAPPATDTTPTSTDIAPDETVPPDTVAGADTVITLDVVDGELVGGSRTESVHLGDTVRVVVTGNTDDEVHVHGYDLRVEPVDGSGEIEFEAIIPGTFEIELEGAGRVLVRMTVS
ncbi:MAG: hypothetical protein R2695_09010 [Acidimicrobiales bacterium]